MKIRLLVLLTFCSGFILGQENILQASKEACKKINSIEYEILQKAAKGKYGRAVINAKITQQKADVKDIGFGKAMMKATGTIKERGVTEPFSFSYDGSQFLFQRGKSKVKKYTKPTKGIVAGLLQQNLFMLHIRHFSQEVPYKPKDRIFGKFQYVEDEVINGKTYHKVKSAMGTVMMKKDGKWVPASKGKQIKAADIFWIDIESKLPKFYTDNFDHKTISVKQLNKNYQKSYFSIANKNTPVKERTYQETQEDITDKGSLLKLNSFAPKWSGVSQNGKRFSSDQLKGKVVLIDFWGTWCPPCIKAMPNIEKLQQLYKNNKDVVIIGISAGERTPLAAENYFKRKGYSYVHIPNGDGIAEIFKVKSYPTLYVLDKTGKIIQSTKDFDSNDFEQAKKMINKHLK